jgi:glycosyltransferase involved in cell wall biosynthesis
MQVMRVAFDVTALHDRRTGVGAFAGEVLTRVARQDDIDVTGYSVSWRGRQAVDGLVPTGVRVASRPMAARPLRTLWQRGDWPPIEWWTGAVDVVHGPNFVVPPSRAAAQLMTIHDLTFVRYPEMSTRDTLQYPGLIRRALRRGAHVHAVSAFVADEIVEVFAVDRDRVHVVPNGVDPIAGGDPDAGRRLAGGARYVLAIGTIEPRKDYPLLIDAFDAVAAQDTEVRLVIAGQDGWDAETFEAHLAKAHHRDRIVRPGYVSDASRADLLRGASVFAYPSRYEGFGLPPLEAMSASVPVVTTRAGALPEELGDAALFVDPGDVDGLAEAITAALDEGPPRAALVERGLEQTRRFSWDACADGVMGTYRHLC